jgi:signal transduction histidine kinase
VVGHVPITAFAGEEVGLSLQEVLGEAHGGETDERDWTYRRRDGSRFIAQVAVGAVRDEDGQLQGYVFMLQDVTERRRAEEAMRRQRDELSHANRELSRSTRLKDDFIAGMSRDLRTPLNAIMGLAEALEERVYGPLGEDQRRAVARIRTSGTQLQTLGDDVLDLFRAEAQRLELRVATVHLGDLCRACLQQVQEEARRRRLAVSLRLDEDAGVVEADGARLAQILLTLWRSAIDGASDGGATGLTVTADPAGEAVRFTLWDTGVGLTDATRQRFFDAFAPASQEKPAGRAGVGLALARRLIELHHGDVEVDSEAGRGTQLTVTIPRHYERMSVPARRTLF